MATLFVDEAPRTLPNPLEIIENLIGANGWAYERMSDDEITAAITGQWCEYQLRFFWREEGRILQTACVFDARVPETKRAAIYETLARINEQMWLGHFEIWAEDGMIMFRHASLVRDKNSIDGLEVCETLIQTALAECERFYPVFQFVIWAGKTPEEALEAAMLETVGEA